VWCSAFAKDHHTQDEIKPALENMKKERAFVSAESVSKKFALDESSDETDTDGGEVDIDANFCQQIVTRTNDIAFASSTFRNHRDLEMAKMNMAISIECAEFRGIILDTGAIRRSTMCTEQYKAYCSAFGVPMRIKKETRSIQGVGGKVIAVGIANAPMPITNLGITIDVEFLILPRCTSPTLLSLKDMRENNIGIYIIGGHLTHDSRKHALHFVKDFWVHKWSPGEIETCLFTEAELRKLHHSFGHPSVNALTNMLRRARPMESDGVRKALESITKNIQICELSASKPRHFRLSIGTDYIIFNHVVAVDVIYLQSKPVLHCVC
jgi:hypothetical protein